MNLHSCRENHRAFEEEKGKSEAVLHEENDPNEVTHSESSEGDSFHDCDYDFSKDDDDEIFQTCVVGPKKELDAHW